MGMLFFTTFFSIMNILFSAVLAAPAAALVAHVDRDDTFSRACEDKEKVVEDFAIRLAENGYSLESRTNTLVTFKPPWHEFFAGRVYAVLESDAVSIVGPLRVLKKLRSVPL